MLQVNIKVWGGVGSRRQRQLLALVCFAARPLEHNLVQAPRAGLSFLCRSLCRCSRACLTQRETRLGVWLSRHLSPCLSLSPGLQVQQQLRVPQHKWSFVWQGAGASEKGIYLLFPLCQRCLSYVSDCAASLFVFSSFVTPQVSVSLRTPVKWRTEGFKKAVSSIEVEIKGEMGYTEYKV